MVGSSLCASGVSSGAGSVTDASAKAGATGAGACGEGRRIAPAVSPSANVTPATMNTLPRRG
jgi:hypothetical protein